MMLTAADLKLRWALTVEDEVVRIHKLFDGEGKVTSDPSRAVTFTAGNDAAIFAYKVSEIVDRQLH